MSGINCLNNLWHKSQLSHKKTLHQICLRLGFFQLTIDKKSTKLNTSAFCLYLSGLKTYVSVFPTLRPLLSALCPLPLLILFHNTAGNAHQFGMGINKVQDVVVIIDGCL